MPEAVVYLVRHGMHDWLRRDRGRLAGRLPGIALNAEGRCEAERVAAGLSAKPLTWVVTSPLERTVQTAEIIARPHGLRIERDERFVESGLGPWEGMAIDEIVARYPADWRAWRENPAQVHLDGIEPLTRIADRMEEGCLEWLGRGGQGIIVSHQDPLAALLCRLIGMPLVSIRAWDVRTGSIAVARRTPHGLVLETVNAGVPLTA